MFRQPRLDPPGTLRHVIGRGIEGQNFQERKGDVQDLGPLARRVGKREGVGELRSGVQRARVSRARRLFCQAAVGRMGDPAAGVARFLGVTPSAVVRAAHSEGLPEIQEYS